MSAWGEAGAGAAMGFLGSVPLAGPVALVVFTRGLSGDVRGGRHLALGAALAEGLLAGLVFAGMGALAAEWPKLSAALDWVGAAVLVLIGLWFLFRGVSDPEQPQEGARGVERPLGAALLGAGMVLGNPGMLGTWGGAIVGLEGTGFIAATAKGAPAFGLGVTVGVIAWFWLALALLARWGSAGRGRAFSVIVRGVGLILVATGVYSLIRAGIG